MHRSPWLCVVFLRCSRCRTRHGLHDRRPWGCYGVATQLSPPDDGGVSWPKMGEIMGHHQILSLFMIDNAVFFHIIDHVLRWRFIVCHLLTIWKAWGKTWGRTRSNWETLELILFWKKNMETKTGSRLESHLVRRNWWKKLEFLGKARGTDGENSKDEAEKRVSIFWWWMNDSKTFTLLEVDTVVHTWKGDVCFLGSEHLHLSVEIFHSGAQGEMPHTTGWCPTLSLVLSRYYWGLPSTP